MTSELKLFGELLTQLWMSHRRPWDYRDGEAAAIYREIADLYPCFGRREELEAFVPSHRRLSTDFKSSRRFLYLDPCYGQPTCVPVLSVRTDFTQAPPEVRLRVGLFVRHEDRVRSIGLRFESPESGDEGIHHYYHGQFITRFYDGAPLKGVPDWLPVTQPAITLEADGPVGLLLSLLVSLYGSAHVGQVIVPALTGDLASYASAFSPEYWSVRTARGQLKYKTWKSRDGFRARMAEQHPGCGMSISDLASYRAEDGEERRVD